MTRAWEGDAIPPTIDAVTMENALRSVVQAVSIFGRDGFLTRLGFQPGAARDAAAKAAASKFRVIPGLPAAVPATTAFDRLDVDDDVREELVAEMASTALTFLELGAVCERVRRHAEAQANRRAEERRLRPIRPKGVDQ